MGRLTVLQQIAQDIAAEFGADCEVVIHDLKTQEPEHSIIYIVNGHVTGRNVGDGPSDAVFDGIRQKRRGDSAPADHNGYLMKTADGKILKCSTSYIKDDDGSLHYVFGINYDITKLTMINSALNDLITPTDKAKDLSAWKQVTRAYCKNGKQSHVECFSYRFPDKGERVLKELPEHAEKPLYALFDYTDRDPLTNNARLTDITDEVNKNYGNV